MGYLVVTAVLVVTFGRMGDMFGRVRMYNAGFLVFSVFSVLLSVTSMRGTGAALWLMPNRAGIMNSLPADQRGVGGGMSTTFQNSAMVLSIGVFFSLMILGLAGTLPHTLSSGLVAQGVPAADADRLAALPPVSVLFASLLGYNPVETLLGPHVLSHLPADHAAHLTGRGFFPALISGPFAKGLATAFAFAIVACLVAAVAWFEPLAARRQACAHRPADHRRRHGSCPRTDDSGIAGIAGIDGIDGIAGIDGADTGIDAWLRGAGGSGRPRQSRRPCSDRHAICPGGRPRHPSDQAARRRTPPPGTQPPVRSRSSSRHRATGRPRTR